MLDPHLDLKHSPSCSLSEVMYNNLDYIRPRPTLSGFQALRIQRQNRLGTLHQQRFCKDLTYLASVQDVNKLTILGYIQTVSSSSYLVHRLGHFMAIVKC